MRDIMGMMGKVKEMQAKMEQMQAEIAELTAEGKAGGGLVTVVISGKGDLKSLKIDPSLFKEDDVEILEDLIVAAHKDAKDKAEALAAEKTKALTQACRSRPASSCRFNSRQLGLKGVSAFFELRKYSISLFSSNSRRKIGPYFCWNCSHIFQQVISQIS